MTTDLEMETDLPGRPPGVPLRSPAPWPNRPTWPTSTFRKQAWLRLTGYPSPPRTGSSWRRTSHYLSLITVERAPEATRRCCLVRDSDSPLFRLEGPTKPELVSNSVAEALMNASLARLLFAETLKRFLPDHRERCPVLNHQPRDGLVRVNFRNARDS